jgi:hypothetical protein
MATRIRSSAFTMLALVALLSVANPTTSDAARAADLGKTMSNVDVYRARGEYKNAELELKGYLERWRSSGISRPDIEAEFVRMEQLMRTMVEMETLIQQADINADAAREYLQRVTTTAEPTKRAAEQARALVLLSKHDKRVHELLRRSFPARLIVEVNGEVPMDELVEIPLTNAAIEMSQKTGLQIWGAPRRDGGDMAIIKVEIMVEQYRGSNAIFDGTSMKSYSFMMNAKLIDDEQHQVAQMATTRQALGITPQHAAKHGIERVAQTLYEEIINGVAKRAALEML